MQVPSLGTVIKPITCRSLTFVEEDKSAVRALAQAAINVELFTIPLYMSTMYSIHGMHQINSRDQSYYKGREWPGRATRADPASDEEPASAEAFNIIFSVFIQEMLHLQMAANIATALGLEPSFTSVALQTENHGWTCYGPDNSIIPHIVDLKDTSTYRDVRVNLEELNENQCQLFLAIEQPEENARGELKGLPPEPEKYFPKVPFADWKVSNQEQDLPLFGTIGWMYECYARYLSIEYTDGESLFHKLFKPGSVQHDMFNTHVDGSDHPRKEFPGFEPLLLKADQTSSGKAFDKVIDMMSAICDQGEGNDITLQRYRKQPLLTDVKGKYQEDRAALDADYPAYDQHGKPAPSGDAAARADNKQKDHYGRFLDMRDKLGKVVTWKAWHQAWDKEGKGWTEADLTNAEYDRATAPANIPAPDQVAGALNRLKQGADTHQMLSQVAVGAIAGITTVLEKYWLDQNATFPYPSMVGSGDRMSICWAICGQPASLLVGLPAPDKSALYHACQGLSLAAPNPHDSCAAIEIYHTCRGSNGCHAQGGCGFAQSDAGGSSSCGSAGCGAKSSHRMAGGSADGTTPYSAPSDNKCATFGGCAVPISASQLYPQTSPPPTMKLYDFQGDDHKSVALDQTMSFAQGDSVYGKAWEAYKAVMASRKQPVTDPMPAPTDLRLALPPST